MELGLHQSKLILRERGVKLVLYEVVLKEWVVLPNIILVVFIYFVQSCRLKQHPI